MNKIVKPCIVEIDGIRYPAYTRIKFDGKELSISGVVGPMSNGNCKGSAGQCTDEIRNGTPAEGWSQEMLEKFCNIWDEWHLNDMRPYCKHQKEFGWDKLATEEVSIYHYRLTREVTDQRRSIKHEAMRKLMSGESVQLAPEEIELLRLKEFPVLPEKTDDPRYAPFNGSTVEFEEKKRLGWLHHNEHPRGILGKACPVCGYEYGTKWVTEEVPAEVIEFLESLPDSETKPAWV